MLRVPVSGLRSGELLLDRAQSRYVARVHRLRAGAGFVAFDPDAGREGDAEVVATGARGVVCRVGALRPAPVVAPLAVELLQALGKGDKAEQAVRDATALGVRRVTIVETARSVPRPGEGRSARWREVAVQAARQSGRGDLPELDGPLALGDALARVAPGSLRLVLAPDAAEPLLRAVAAWDGASPLALLIGPEGGLAPDELELALGQGFRRVGFGRLILRTETASTAALGALVAVAEHRRSERE